VSYSDNSGQSWEIIGDNIDAHARSFAWNVPNAMTEEGIVKVEKIGGPVLSAQSKSFSIKQNLTGFEVNPICEGMVQFLWGYGDGEIYPTSAIQLQGEETITLEVANNNFYTHLKPLAEGEKHWFAVAHPQGEKGAGRTIAKSVIPTYNAICPWTDDVKLTAEPTTYTGRFATSSSKFTIQLPVIVKNIGSQDQEDLEINYQLEGTHVDKIPGVLASGDQYTFNLIKTVRDMQPGIYPVDLYTNIPGDPTANHYLDDIVEVEIIPNAPVELPFELEIPTAVHYSYDQSEMGLEQLQRMDFQQNGEGRLDVSSWNGEGAVIVHSQNHGEFNEALITLNMKNYAIDNQVNLNLRYAAEGSGNASFYIRGSDQDDWVLISELTNTQEWVEIENIAINDLLAQANHEFSASTQLKIVQNGIGAIGISDIIIDGDIVVNLPDYQNHLLSVVADQNYYLTWTNNYENYGYSYEIQYAQDSLALTRDQYDVYQIITGQGETLTGRTYDVELEGLATNQRYFFRIKTIDESGAEYFSNISSLLLIDNSIEKGLAMQLKNLVEGDLNVNFSVPSRSRIQINLISSNGARVYSESITLDEGIHSHAINSGIMAQKGLYLLEVQSHQETLQQKIVKH
ncbi:MAG: T9SS type A sorting domain-containing protein, partial [Bacteroidia bacterium]|nr:T9SS type A sorting domain-containing protein [Bacteroidia bacterium]